MMKKLVLAFMICLFAVAVLLAVPGTTRELDQSSFSPSISLGLFGPAVALAQPDSTFPVEEAGLAAYLMVNPPPDMDKAITSFDELYLMGGNWVVGRVMVDIYPSYSTGKYIRQDVYVYIDSQGWVVAYLKRDTPPAAIMVWTGIDEMNPSLEEITTTALEEAMDKVLLSAGIEFASLRDQVGYYAFQYPEATGITLAAIVGGKTYQSPVSFSLAVAEGATVYSESVCLLNNHFGAYRCPNFYSYDIYGNPRFSQYGSPLLFSVEASYTAGLSYRYGISWQDSGGVFGMAVVVVYKTS